MLGKLPTRLSLMRNLSLFYLVCFGQMANSMFLKCIHNFTFLIMTKLLQEPFVSSLFLLLNIITNCSDGSLNSMCMQCPTYHILKLNKYYEIETHV